MEREVERKSPEELGEMIGGLAKKIAEWPKFWKDKSSLAPEDRLTWVVQFLQDPKSVDAKVLKNQATFERAADVVEAGRLYKQMTEMQVGGEMGADQLIQGALDSAQAAVKNAAPARGEKEPVPEEAMEAAIPGIVEDKGGKLWKKAVSVSDREQQLRASMDAYKRSGRVIFPAGVVSKGQAEFRRLVVAAMEPFMKVKRAEDARLAAEQDAAARLAEAEAEAKGMGTGAAETAVEGEEQKESLEEQARDEYNRLAGERDSLADALEAASDPEIKDRADRAIGERAVEIARLVDAWPHLEAVDGADFVAEIRRIAENAERLNRKERDQATSKDDLGRERRALIKEANRRIWEALNADPGTAGLSDAEKAPIVQALLNVETDPADHLQAPEALSAFLFEFNKRNLQIIDELESRENPPAIGAENENSLVELAASGRAAALPGEIPSDRSVFTAADDETPGIDMTPSPLGPIPLPEARPMVDVGPEAQLRQAEAAVDSMREAALNDPAIWKDDVPMERRREVLNRLLPNPYRVPEEFEALFQPAGGNQRLTEQLNDLQNAMMDEQDLQRRLGVSPVFKLADRRPPTLLPLRESAGEPIPVERAPLTKGEQKKALDALVQLHRAYNDAKKALTAAEGKGDNVLVAKAGRVLARRANEMLAAYAALPLQAQEKWNRDWPGRGGDFMLQAAQETERFGLGPEERPVIEVPKEEPKPVGFFDKVRNFFTGNKQPEPLKDIPQVTTYGKKGGPALRANLLDRAGGPEAREAERREVEEFDDLVSRFDQAVEQFEDALRTNNEESADRWREFAASLARQMETRLRRSDTLRRVMPKERQAWVAKQVEATSHIVTEREKLTGGRTKKTMERPFEDPRRAAEVAKTAEQAGEEQPAGGPDAAKTGEIPESVDSALGTKAKVEARRLNPESQGFLTRLYDGLKDRWDIHKNERLSDQTQKAIDRLAGKQEKQQDIITSSTEKAAAIRQQLLETEEAFKQMSAIEGGKPHTLSRGDRVKIEKEIKEFEDKAEAAQKAWNDLEGKKGNLMQEKDDFDRRSNATREKQDGILERKQQANQKVIDGWTKSRDAHQKNIEENERRQGMVTESLASLQERLKVLKASKVVGLQAPIQRSIDQLTVHNKELQGLIKDEGKKRDELDGKISKLEDANKALQVRRDDVISNEKTIDVDEIEPEAKAANAPRPEPTSRKQEDGSWKFDHPTEDGVVIVLTPDKKMTITMPDGTFQTEDNVDIAEFAEVNADRMNFTSKELAEMGVTDTVLLKAAEDKEQKEWDRTSEREEALGAEKAAEISKGEKRAEMLMKRWNRKVGKGSPEFITERVWKQSRGDIKGDLSDEGARKDFFSSMLARKVGGGDKQKVQKSMMAKFLEFMLK